MIQSAKNSVGDIVFQKMQNAKKRGYFHTVDLFAGCGGMSLGFHRAEFRCVAGVEIDSDARASHELNFAGSVPPGKYRAFGDVTNLEAADAISHLSQANIDPSKCVDIVIGGPPCQAFSRLGRAALWRLADEDHAHRDDSRATMYEHYLRYVTQLKPLAFVMENVREIGKFVGRNIAEEISLTAEDLGYDVKYTLLNAVWFGVPQLRERAIIIGIRKELGVHPSFPKILCRHELPVGYSTSRAGTGRIEFLEPHDHYVDHLDFARRTRNAVTLQEAFADIPPIYDHLNHLSSSKKARNLENETAYSITESDYSKEMREWPGFTNLKKSFTGHVIRYTPRDYETFRRMPQGGMYPEALEVANQIFNERLALAEKNSGKKIRQGSAEWNEIFKSTVPPYKEGRYPNKFRKLWADQPSRTLPAHIGKDSYSHIHYDSKQARGISLREAARIQSFPDTFKFHGSMNSCLRQIGNAVPPLLAYRIAEELKRTLNRSNYE